MQVKAPRGTADILPDNTAKWQKIERIIKERLESFAYQEVRIPVFEHTELFQHGVGQSTDIVSKEMYTFNDRSERSLTLRPEGTASCARAIIEHSIYGGVLPVKWYYTGPMFRYDRPQAGRYRQFHQVGVEAFGSNSPYLDAETIILMVEILSALGLTAYELHLNSVGCPVCRQIYRQSLIDHISPVKNSLCPDCQLRFQQNPLRVLDCKVAACHEAIAGYPVIHDSLCVDCREHYAKVRTALTDNNVDYIHDDQLVRGLDYYTNTAFEIHIPGIGAQSAVGGGGRYNGLVQALGGPYLPGIGFALGMERLLLALDTLGLGESPPPGIDVFIALMNDRFETQALKILNKIRQAGIRADKDYTGRSGKAQMKYADRLGAKLVILIGDEEIEQGFYTLRNMQTKEQFQLDNEQLVDSIKQIMAKD